MDMCGIAGIIDLSGISADDRHRLNRMAHNLRHRGPDDSDVYSDGTAALGHTRLSIIDLSTGRQPLSNEDGTVWIVFNGEIYNFAELRAELEAKGHTFRTASDTEVIVHLYEEKGVECLHRLRGMFAFAIWDTPRQRLFLARDRLGEKPLVYAAIGNRIAFASEINALLELPHVSREIDVQALDSYFCCGYIPHPRSVFRDVRKLPPAHYAVFEGGRLDVRR
jgi:asparagine synthase (glutamine-hydrolysing)